MIDGYVKTSDLAAFNADVKPRIQADYVSRGLTRVFDNYTSAKPSAGIDSYAFVNGDYMLIANPAELAAVMTKAEAITDGMIVPGNGER